MSFIQHYGRCIYARIDSESNEENYETLTEPQLNTKIFSSLNPVHTEKK